MIITYDDLKQIRQTHKNQSIVIGLGSFDLLHWEHLQFINDCKKMGDILVVAVKDNLAVSKKGENRPIIDEKQRVELIDNLKSVDYVILANKRVDINPLIEKYNISSNEAEQEWWQLFYPIFEKLQPDILNYEIGHPVQHSRAIYLKEHNIKAVPRNYRGLVTTSKIVNKIKHGVNF